jgi:ADP-heptose:LPS heptosyltransferase
MKIQNPKRILIIKWGALGDIIMGTSAIRSVRENFPEAKVTLLSNSLIDQVVPAGSIVDEVLIYNEEKEISPSALIRLFKIIRLLRKKKFDLAVNLRWTSDRCAFLAFMSGAKIRVSSGPHGMMWCYNIKLQHPVGRYHELHRNLDIVKAVGVEVKNETPFIFVSKEDDEFASQFFAEKNMVKEKTVCIHPGASKSIRAWPADRYNEIARRIVEQFDLNVMITWGKGEFEWAQAVAKNGGGKIILAPETKTVGRLSALIKNCVMCITNCTGPMNVAIAVETPTIALLGSTDPLDWSPYFEIHRTVKSPLVRETYTDEQEQEAMEAISVEQVWNVVRDRITEFNNQTP